MPPETFAALGMAGLIAAIGWMVSPYFRWRIKRAAVLGLVVIIILAVAFNMGSSSPH